MTPIILTVVAISFASAGAMFVGYIAQHALRDALARGLKF